MTMQSDLRACLLPVVANGVHFAVLPLDAGTVTSAIVIPTEMVTPDNTICGASDLDDHRVQVDLYASSYGAMIALRPQVFAAIETKFPLAVRISDMADYDADLKLHRRIVEYSIPSE